MLGPDAPVLRCEVGLLALQAGELLPLEILQSQAGFYLGTAREGLFSRESNEYFPTREAAERAKAFGDWTQRTTL